MTRPGPTTTGGSSRRPAALLRHRRDAGPGESDRTESAAKRPRHDAARRTQPGRDRSALRVVVTAATRPARASWSSASAAIQPDISTIGMPGPGWAAPPARYRPGRSRRRLPGLNAPRTCRGWPGRRSRRSARGSGRGCPAASGAARQRCAPRGPPCRPRAELVEDHAAVGREHRLPVVVRAAGRACGRGRRAPRRRAGRRPARCARARRGSRSGRAPVRPCRRCASNSSSGSREKTKLWCSEVVVGAFEAEVEHHAGAGGLAACERCSNRRRWPAPSSSR